MLPSSLREKSFSHYPAQARALAVASLPTLQRIPLAVLPLILSQLINFDWLFPPEKRDMKEQLGYVAVLQASDFDALMQPFGAIHVPQQITDSDWVNRPKEFVERLSAFLWSVHQIDDYHRAIESYMQRLNAGAAKDPPETPRLTIVVIGAGVKETQLPVFRRLRPHGTLFTSVNADSAWQAIAAAVETRAEQFPREHAHWYIDGGEPDAGLRAARKIDLVSYSELAPVVRKELALLNRYVNQPPAGDTTNVEAMISYMADLTPQELGLGGSDPVLQRFAVELLTEGSGTQVYSTTFVQWAARECLHRAQPLTLVARFTPRQEAGTMNQLLARDPFTQPTDAEGSLVDADMGAYYTWINQNRLPGAEQAKFFAWFEGHNTVIAIGPAMAKGTTSDMPVDLKKVMEWMA
jgi:hypothetical protein